MRLICFPHAGGLSVNYRSLKSQLENRIPGLTVTVFEYSGHGRRFREAMYTDLFQASVRIAAEILKDIRLEECFFLGHSMGAYIAVEVAYRLQEMGELVPRMIFVSGQDAPVNKGSHYAEMNEEDFWKYIVSLGAVDPQLLTNEWYRKFIEGMIRNDLRIAESYVPTNAKLNVDLDILYGENDPEINYTVLDHWKNITSGIVRYQCFSGGHFYIFDHQRKIVQYISKRLGEVNEKNILGAGKCMEDRRKYTIYR